MRVKRVYKFKKLRHKKFKAILGYGIIIPSSLLLTGYLISLLFILPLINK